MTVQEWGLALLVVSQLAASAGAIIAGWNRFWKIAALFVTLSVAGFVSEVIIGWDQLTW